MVFAGADSRPFQQIWQLFNSCESEFGAGTIYLVVTSVAHGMEATE
jgi:hypothetical protein